MKRMKYVSAMLVTLLMASTTVFGAENMPETVVGKVLENSEAYTTPEAEKRTCYVFEGETFEIVEELDAYYGVLLEKDEVIYIEKDSMMVEKDEEEVKEETPKKETTPVKEVVAEVATKSKGEQIVDYAKKFIGTPYVYGGTSLTSGVDCSGFTQQVFRNFNINLQRTSGAQYSSNGTSIKKQDLKPGDLVFYGYGSVSHVAIYIGDNQIIHSPAPGQGVKIAPLWQRGDAPLLGYKRVA